MPDRDWLPLPNDNRSFAERVSPDAGDEPGGKTEEAMLFCPRCSTRLSELKCKLICDKCGYYMSCADYY